MKESNRRSRRTSLMLLDAMASIAVLLALRLVDNFTSEITELEQINYAEQFPFAAALFFSSPRRS